MPSLKYLDNVKGGVSASILKTNKYMYCIPACPTLRKVLSVLYLTHDTPPIEVLTSLLLFLRLYNQQVVLLSGDVTDYSLSLVVTLVVRHS